MTEYILVRIQAIQDELEALKQLIIESESTKPYKTTTKIQGLWRGLAIDDEDLEAAKQAIFQDPI